MNNQNKHTVNELPKDWVFKKQAGAAEKFTEPQMHGCG